MSDGRKYYCICEANCKFETMTKEQILAAITQVFETGSVIDVDTGFVTKVKETNSGGYISFWVGTSAQYNALQTTEKNCIYILTDDTKAADLEARLQQMQTDIEAAAGSARVPTLKDYNGDGVINEDDVITLLELIASEKATAEDDWNGDGEVDAMDVVAYRNLVRKWGDKVPMPTTAAVGQYLRVREIDDNGRIVALEAVDAPV